MAWHEAGNLQRPRWKRARLAPVLTLPSARGREKRQRSAAQRRQHETAEWSGGPKTATSDSPSAPAERIQGRIEGKQYMRTVPSPGWESFEWKPQSERVDWDMSIGTCAQNH
ncbi:hypothetical protein P154DRAFT_574648 [Amniculicola lignicola CBS 123094]|uniref:Uncharacterized protein n=1 Tax=Amniculicola lignicola CBS 123094 TaxID=1392246 RepID=A0A6A5WMI0_9PLEO|nr:hypothetical protein P154DRAFT_574648 [Amniculicola lignicola CBS 123094]